MCKFIVASNLQYINERMTLICPTSGFLGGSSTTPSGGSPICYTNPSSTCCPDYVIKDHQQSKNADTATLFGSLPRHNGDNNNNRLLIDRMKKLSISMSLEDVSICTPRQQQQQQQQQQDCSCVLLDERNSSMQQSPRSILKKAASADAASIAALRETLSWSTDANNNNNVLSLSMSDSNLSYAVDCSEETNCETGLLVRSLSKNVTFADDKNLSLVKIHNFVPSTECLDQYHFSAFHQTHFQVDNVAANRQLPSPLKSVNRVFRNPAKLLLCFNEPCDSLDFKERFGRECVALERCATRDRTVTGIIVVKNLEYQKYVGVRYTMDSWKTSDEIEACYVPNSNDGATDRFSFTLSLPKTYKEMEFAVRFRAGDSTEYWDNNFSRNYKVKDALHPL